MLTLSTRELSLVKSSICATIDSLNRLGFKSSLKCKQLTLLYTFILKNIGFSGKVNVKMVMDCLALAADFYTTFENQEMRRELGDIYTKLSNHFESSLLYEAFTVRVE